MSELARRTDTPRETIHHYLRLGLLSKPAKTSKNMAWYDQRHVDELKLIQKLRSESYLPLDKIKLILDEGRLAASAREIDIAGDMFGRGAKIEAMDARALAERTGLDEALIAQAVDAKILRPTASGFGWEDLRVAEVIAESRSTPAIDEAMVERLGILDGHVAAMVDDELRHFFAMVAAGIEAESGLELLRSGRETLGRFLAVARARRMKEAIEGVFTEVAALARAPFVPAPPVPIERRDRGASGDLDHLLLMGDFADVMARAGHDDAPAYAEAAVELARYPEALARLGPYRALVGDRHPRVDIAWAAAVLGATRDAMAATGSDAEPWSRLAALRGDVMRDLISGLTQLARAAARAEKLSDPLDRARTSLLLGRVYALTPRFLGLAPAAHVALARARDDAASLLPDRHGGAIERIIQVASAAAADLSARGG